MRDRPPIDAIRALYGLKHALSSRACVGEVERARSYAGWSVTRSTPKDTIFGRTTSKSAKRVHIVRHVLTARRSGYDDVVMVVWRCHAATVVEVVQQHDPPAVCAMCAGLPSTVPGESVPTTTVSRKDPTS